MPTIRLPWKLLTISAWVLLTGSGLRHAVVLVSPVTPTLDYVSMTDSNSQSTNKNRNQNNDTSSGSTSIARDEREWCPHSTCHDSSLCEPCRQRFLIIIASGRSGSTTLLHMINALPNVRMAGENNGALGLLKHAIRSVTQHRKYIYGTDRIGAWFHNEIPQGAMACAAQSFVATINPPPQEHDGNFFHNETRPIIGFKTIRFLKNFNAKRNVSQEEIFKADLDMVDFMKEHFPCTRYLVNIRSNTTAQVTSTQNLWKEGTVQKQESHNRRLKRLVDLFGPEQAHLLDSSSWFHNVSLLDEAVQWLGFRGCTFGKVLEFYTEMGDRHGDTDLKLAPACHN